MKKNMESPEYQALKMFAALSIRLNLRITDDFSH